MYMEGASTGKAGCRVAGRARGPDALSRLLESFERELPPLPGMPEGYRKPAEEADGPLERLRKVCCARTQTAQPPPTRPPLPNP